MSNLQAFNHAETWTEDSIQLLKDTYAKDLNEKQFAVYMKMARALDLNPFTREIYGMVVSGRLVLITSIDGFRKIAHRTGAYLGCDVYVEFDDNEKPICATATVKKLVQGVVGEFKATVMFKEFNTGKNNWAKMPVQMISKVAEAHALRRAFNEVEQIYMAEEFERVNQPAGSSEKAENLTERFKNSEPVEIPEYQKQRSEFINGLKDLEEDNVSK